MPDRRIPGASEGIRTPDLHMTSASSGNLVGPLLMVAMAMSRGHFAFLRA
jgi:hypothetical protein